MAKHRKGLRKVERVAGCGDRLVFQRLVPDPSKSDAEYRRERAERPGPASASVVATVNLIETIGGLARIRDRTSVQEEAAARYRKLWDRAQRRGLRAIDYTQASASGGAMGDSGYREAGEQAIRDYREAVQMLGMVRSSLVERVIVHDESVRSVAGNGRRAQVRCRDELLFALDDLAVTFGLATKART